MNEGPSSSRRPTKRGAVPEAAVASEAHPALRDADSILARAANDEAAAHEARERYRDREMEPIEPDARIAGLLRPGEDLLAVRRSALLDRREPIPGGAGGAGSRGLAGDLYVTSARLVHVGRTVVECDLDAIWETIVSAGRLLLIVRDGAGMALDVDQPRLLRVEIGLARAKRAARASVRDADLR